MLKIKDVDAYYADLQAIWGISMQVNEGELVALIGPNGAGKTTTLRLISGLLKPASGDIHFQSHDLAKETAHRIVEMGISQVPEGGKIFTGMSTLENLELGAYVATARKVRDQTLEWVYEIFPRLKERKDQLAGTLSGGERQMLAIGRALMSKPRLLMLDEPSFGLAPKMVKATFEAAVAIAQTAGISVVIVEQEIKEALRIADWAYVIKKGEIVLEGDHESLNFEKIQQAYF